MDDIDDLLRSDGTQWRLENDPDPATSEQARHLQDRLTSRPIHLGTRAEPPVTAPAAAKRRLAIAVSVAATMLIGVGLIVGSHLLRSAPTASQPTTSTSDRSTAPPPAAVRVLKPPQRKAAVRYARKAIRESIPSRQDGPPIPYEKAPAIGRQWPANIESVNAQAMTLAAAGALIHEPAASPYTSHSRVVVLQIVGRLSFQGTKILKSGRMQTWITGTVLTVIIDVSHADGFATQLNERRDNAPKLQGPVERISP